MCLTIFFTDSYRKARIRERKIADKDIIVWKNLRKAGNGIFKSPHQEFIYERGFLYFQTGIQFSYFDCGYKMEVQRGLHSWKTRKEAQIQKNWPCITFEMVIPKGSIYYEGYLGDIVSNQLWFP